MYGAQHIGAIREDFGFSRENFDVRDVEAGEMVKAYKTSQMNFLREEREATFHGDLLVVVYICCGETGNVDFGSTVEIDYELFAR